MSLIYELRRRRVLRVALIYGLAAVTMTEAASIVAPEFNLPEWTVRFVIVFLIIGFPFAMILAWIFDIRRTGIERTKEAPGADKRQRSKRSVVVYGTLLTIPTLLLGGILYYLSSDHVVAKGPKESIAVLPFDNYSGNPENDYFSDGISEELLNLLAKVPGLQVAGRTSSFAYKNENIDARVVGAELGVATVLDGSVRWAGDRVRISAQLIDAESGFELWSETYDQQLDDIFKVQDEIALEIVRALRIELGEGVSPDMVTQAPAPTENIEAYRLYLEGKFKWKRRGKEAILKSIELFRAAIEEDPKFGRAHAALAAAYVLAPEYADEPAEVYYPLAGAAAAQALAVDATLAEAHAVLAQIAALNGNWTDAESDFFFATSLDARDPTAAHWYSGLLRNTGRLDQALIEALRAYELDKTSPVLNGNLAGVYLELGDNEKALEYANAAAQLGYEGDLNSIRILVHMRRGEFEAARALIDAKAARGDDKGEMLGRVVQAIGDSSLKPDLLASLDQRDPAEVRGELFWIYMLLGENDRLFALAEGEVSAARFPVQLLWMQESAALRADPRFFDLVKKLGLVQFWKQYGWPDLCEPTDDGIRCN